MSRHTISRITRARCSCGFDDDLAFFESDDWKKPCPKCGATLTPEDHKPERTYGNRRFTESEGESITQGFHPKEVNVARKLMPKSAGCIKDDGRVVYEDSKQAATFHKELGRAKRRLGVPSGPPWAQTM